MLKSAIKSYCFVSHDFMSRPFCSHVAMLQDGASSGVFFVNKLIRPVSNVEFCMHRIQFTLDSTAIVKFDVCFKRRI